MCNNEIEEGPANLKSYNLGSCEKHLVFEHAAGCTKYSALRFANWLDTNAWFSGTFLLVFGAVIGLFGQKYFLKIAGASAAFFAFWSWLVVASMLMWMNTTFGTIMSILVGACCATGAYLLFSRHRDLKWGGSAIRMLSLFGGFLFGSMVEGVIIAAFGWESFALYLIVTISCMVFSFWFGWNHPRKAKRWITSCLGAFFCMRGMTYFLGGFPSEMDMYAMLTNPEFEHYDFTSIFWVYITSFFVGALFFVYLQNNVDYFKKTPKTAAEKL